MNSIPAWLFQVTSRPPGYDRQLDQSIAHMSGFTYAPEGDGSLLADTLARGAVTEGTDYGTDNSLNCVEGAAEMQEHLANQNPPVHTEIVVVGDHAVLRMPDGRYVDPTRVMNGDANDDPFLSPEEAARYEGVDGITIQERRELEQAGADAADALGPNATPEQREAAAIDAVRTEAREGGHVAALDAANEGEVDPEALAAEDAATVQHIYETEGPEAAARKLEELAAANQHIPGYVDALIRNAEPTLKSIGVDLAARVTNGDDDDEQDGNLTQDTLTSLAHLANMAGEEGQSILGAALAGPLPGGEGVNLNQYDDVFRDLGEDGAALGGAVVMALEHGGNTHAAKDLGEDVKKNEDGTFKTKATGTTVGGSYDHQWGTVQGDGPTDSKKTDGESSTDVEVASAEVDAEVDSGLGVEGSTEVGGVAVEGHVSGPSLRLGASASGSVGQDGLELSVVVNVDATLAEAGTSGTITVPVQLPGGEVVDVTVTLSADAMAGAYGTLTINVSLGPDGQPVVEVKGEGFVGLTGSIAGSVTISHEGNELMTGSLTVSGALGAGGGFELDAGMENGNLTFKAEGKLVAGAGGGVSVDGEVNVANSAIAIKEILIGLVRAGFEEGAEVAIDTGEAVWNMGQAAGGAVWDGTEWVGRQVWNGTEWVVRGAGDLLEDAWDKLT